MSSADFAQFRDLGGGLRLVVSTVMDEEEFVTSEWHLYRGTEWRPTVAGIHAYAKLRERRKEERKSAWQTRVEREDEYSDSITELIEQRDKEGSEQ